MTVLSTGPLVWYACARPPQRDWHSTGHFFGGLFGTTPPVATHHAKQLSDATDTAAQSMREFDAILHSVTAGRKSVPSSMSTRSRLEGSVIASHPEQVHQQLSLRARYENMTKV